MIREGDGHLRGVEFGALFKVLVGVRDAPDFRLGERGALVFCLEILAARHLVVMPLDLFENV